MRPLKMTKTLPALPCLCVFLLLFAVPPTAGGRAKFVTVRGREFVAPDGRVLFLKGINLGNWLLPEGYMFKFKSANSPRRIEAVLNQLVGEEEARRFWKAYLDNYVTFEDIRFIKQAGFNSVRVPFNYRLFVAEGDAAKVRRCRLRDARPGRRLVQAARGSTSSSTCTAHPAGRPATI